MRASNSFDGQETVEGSTFKDGEALLSLTEPFVGQGVTYMEHLVSQNIVNIKNTDHPVWEDLETQASEDELHFELRRQAQQQLLKHAQNALSMHESKNRSDQQTESAVMSIKSLETLPNEPDYVEQLQESSLNGDVISPIASLEQQEVLERFISTLKNDGVEVLKLGRRNNWQIRYLTVSRESSSTGGHSPQFPRALLWLKQFKADTYSIDAIKVKGRGGVLFSQLMSVDLANTDSFYFTNADSFYQKILPKKFQPKFPTSCGVVLTYVYESGVRKLLLCFKNEGDAKSFCTSMRIIKKLSDKWADIEQSNAENMEIETFDTFPSKS